MKPEAINQAIAEAVFEHNWIKHGVATTGLLTRFTTDLNAMHEAEKVLHDMENWEACNYENQLNTMTSNWTWHATAAQRAEAFLKSLNKWED